MSTELTTINPNALKSQSEWIAQRNRLIEEAKAVKEVNDQEGLEVAGRLDAEAGRMIKALADERMKLTRPLDAAKKSIMSAEKEMVASIEAEKNRLNTLVKAYATKQMLAAREAERIRLKEEQEAAELAAQAELEAEAANADPFAAEPPPPPAPPIREPVPYVEPPRTSSNSFTLVTKFEVIEEGKVPREFCSPDEAKIRKFLAYQKEIGQDSADIKISGVKIWQESQVRAR